MVEKTAKRLGVGLVNIFAMALAAPNQTYAVTSDAIWAFNHFMEGSLLPDYTEAFCLIWLTATFSTNPIKVKVQ